MISSQKDTAEALRTFGHRLIDQMADYLEGIESRPVSTPKQPHELARHFAEPLPREGKPAEEVWDEVWNLVVKDSIHFASPMYMGHQVAPPLPHAVLADTLASLLNQSLAVWEMSPTGTLVEAQVVRWLLGLLGFPASADGTLVSGGSVANLTGLLRCAGNSLPGMLGRRRGPYACARPSGLRRRLSGGQRRSSAHASPRLEHGYGRRRYCTAPLRNRASAVSM